MMSKFQVGDRFSCKHVVNHCCTLIKIRNSGKKPYTVQYENGRKVHCDESWLDGMKFLEEKGAIAKCNSHNLTSAQESGLDSALQDSAQDSNLSESQKLMNTAVISSPSDIQAYTTTATCEISPELQNADLAQSLKSTETAKTSTLRTICNQEESTLSQPVPLAPHSPQKANGLEVQTSVIASPQSSKSLANCNLNLQPLKTFQDSSLAPTTQNNPQVHISEAYSTPLTSSGTMRNGLLSAVDTLPVPSLESEYCWLRSPGALSLSGKGRPPGQTKQEAQLKKLGAIATGQVVNPEFLESAYNLPLGWTDPQESRSALELLAEMESPAIAAQPLEMLSIGELQPLDSAVSPTLISCPACQQELLTLNNRCGVCGWIPKKFLEETKQATSATEKPKARQRKGCLYKYIENKKLKNGTIASYPRVIGDRKPDNPTHWRWGFNWEQKIDGEWKGRSIGSVPVGVIALIQSMQNEGVPLEEIIGFIKRAKAKK
jgi:hypothetical protein